MARRRKRNLTDLVSSPVTSSVKPVQGRQFRDRVTRVGSPIKGAVTNAKQWNRWTP